MKDFKNIKLNDNENFDISKMEHPKTIKQVSKPKIMRREFCLYLQPKIMKAFKLKVNEQDLKVNEVIESLLSDYLNK